MSTGRLGAGDSAIQSTIVDAKGDLIVATAADTPARLAVGSNGQVVIADSTQATGIKWGVDPTTDVVTTAGDLIYATAADAVTRLGIGTAGQVLKVNSGATAPEWGAVTATTYPTFSAYSNTDQSQTANTWTKKNFEVEEWDTANNFASSRFTPTTAGYYQVSAGLYANDTGTLGLAFYKNGSEWKGQAWAGSGSNYRCQLTAIVYLNGSTDYVEVYSRSSSGNLYNGAGSVWFQGVGIRG